MAAANGQAVSRPKGVVVVRDPREDRGTAQSQQPAVPKIKSRWSSREVAASVLFVEGGAGVVAWRTTVLCVEYMCGESGC